MSESLSDKDRRPLHEEAWERYVQENRDICPATLERNRSQIEKKLFFQLTVLNLSMKNLGTALKSEFFSALTPQSTRLNNRLKSQLAYLYDGRADNEKDQIYAAINSAKDLVESLGNSIKETQQSMVQILISGAAQREELLRLYDQSPLLFRQSPQILKDMVGCSGCKAILAIGENAKTAKMAHSTAQQYKL